MDMAVDHDSTLQRAITRQQLFVSCVNASSELSNVIDNFRWASAASNQIAAMKNKFGTHRAQICGDCLQRSEVGVNV